MWSEVHCDYFTNEWCTSNHILFGLISFRLCAYIYFYVYEVCNWRTLVRYHFGSPFSSEMLWFVDTVLQLCPSFPTETLKWLSSLPILMQKSFWWWQCSDRYIISLSPHLHTPFPPVSPSQISLMVSVDIKHHVYFTIISIIIIT